MENRVKIFVVDDDLFTLNIYRQGLENFGYQNITLFLNGTVCLNNLNKKPKVIFLDHDMNELSGFEVLKKIKRYDPNIYVILVSAQEKMNVAIDALKYGAFDYIIKGDDDLDKMQKALFRIEGLEREINAEQPSLIKKILPFI